MESLILSKNGTTIMRSLRNLYIWCSRLQQHHEFGGQTQTKLHLEIQYNFPKDQNHTLQGRHASYSERYGTITNYLVKILIAEEPVKRYVFVVPYLL